MIVIYTGPDEVIVTTDADERQMVKDYFDNDAGRDLEDYDRSESASGARYEVAVISTRIRTDFE